MKYAAIYLIIINAVAFLLMLSDKLKAQRRQYRIPEATLMGAAAIGGSLGAMMGMHLFHHKTKHPKFTVGIPMILTVQVALAVWLTSILY
jgi:uncharacterized membrane protein YsdA (DUF1294 family)